MSELKILKLQAFIFVIDSRTKLWFQSVDFFRSAVYKHALKNSQLSSAELIDTVVEAAFVQDNPYILSFWKNVTSMPPLQNQTKFILSIPASSSSIDKVFSYSNKIHTKERPNYQKECNY